VSKPNILTRRVVVMDANSHINQQLVLLFKLKKSLLMTLPNSSSRERDLGGFLEFSRTQQASILSSDD